MTLFVCSFVWVRGQNFARDDRVNSGIYNMKLHYNDLKKIISINNLKEILLEEEQEKTITVYRGISGWFPRREKTGGMGGKITPSGMRMTQDGHFVGPSTTPQFPHPTEDRRMKDTTIWVTDDRDMAGDERFTWRDDEDWYSRQGGWGNSGPVLQFDIPESYFNQFAGLRSNDPSKISGHMDSKRIYFEDGIPKKFLTKVHKTSPGKIPRWDGGRRW